MIAAWMLVSALLGVVIALGALALDGVCRAARMPGRWTWTGALGLVVLLTALVPVRRIGDAGMSHVPATHVTTATDSASPAAVTMSPLSRTLAAARAMIDAPVARLARAAARVVPPVADRWLLAAWIGCSLALLVLTLLVLRRLLDARDTWPVVALDGERVHVAPDVGPAVLGFSRAAIVVPRWLTECAADVQRVVLAHEREHVRARDPLLLALGTAAVVLVPWNPAVWWMAARLRLALELDCDRRVLDAGTHAHDYGVLLIDLAGRTAAIPLPAPLVGLTMPAERTTHLERRIIAMSATRPRHVALRIAAGSLVALVAALAACESRMPTSVDVDNMTAASAERTLVSERMLGQSDTLNRYYINGFLAGAADAHALKSGQIATITVRRDTTMGSKGAVWITTRDAPGEAATAERAMTPAAASGTRQLTFRARPDTARFAGLIFIDGRRADQRALGQLAPGSIASVEVTKGVRAAELYPNDPAAAQGVIQVTTKPSAQ